MRARKLAAVKVLINGFTPIVIRTVPKPGPRRPVTEMTRRLFQLLRKAQRLNPERLYADGNFPKLLDAAERILSFIAEEDPHYAGWLAQAMLLVHDLVEETRPGFGPGTVGDVAWLEWAAQHLVSRVQQGET